MSRDIERMHARRTAFLADRDVYRDIRPDSPLRVLWVSGSYEPYDGPVTQQILVRARGAPEFRRSVGGPSWEVEVETVDERTRYGTLVLRDADDMPRSPDGEVDLQRCGAPNAVILVWRADRRPDGHHTAGGWVHLEAFDGEAPPRAPEPAPASATQEPVTDARLAAYLRWWERRPCRWLAMLRADHSEDALPDLPGAEFFEGDSEAHWRAVELGLLVQDPRPRVTSWQITGRGLCFVHEHFAEAAPEPEQLALF